MLKLPKHVYELYTALIVGFRNHQSRSVVIAYSRLRRLRRRPGLERTLLSSITLWRYQLPTLCAQLLPVALDNRSESINLKD